MLTVTNRYDIKNKIEKERLIYKENYDKRTKYLIDNNTIMWF